MARNKSPTLCLEEAVKSEQVHKPEILLDLIKKIFPTHKAIHKLFSWSSAIKKIKPQKFLQVLKSNFY